MANRDQSLQILPFRGLCYDLEKAQGSLAQLTAPPYDVINPSQQAAFYQQHPANVIRLILNQPTDQDNETQNVYTRAAGFFSTWQKDGILAPTPAPALYAYTQTWEGIERRGLIGLLKLESFESGKVLPHEHTLGGPKVDRLNLMQATLANLSQIFMIYADPDCLLERYLDNQPTDAAWLEATDADGVVHRYRPITDPAQLTPLQEMFAGQTLLIADGHHRYETALTFKALARKTLFTDRGLPEPPEGALTSDYVMVFLTNMEDPGLRVFPTHRVLYRWPEGWTKERFEAELMQRMAPAPAAPGDWAYWPAGAPAAQPLQLKDRSLLNSLPEPLQGLDVAQLEAVVFQGLFGQSAEALKANGTLGFYRNEPEVEAMLQNGQAVAAFWMQAPPVATVRTISEAGLRMPQKSTYFYPKLLSGLVFHAYAPFPGADGHSLSGVREDAMALPQQLFASGAAVTVS